MKLSNRLRYYKELTKPRILVMQIVTLGMGFFIGKGPLPMNWALFGYAALGTALVSAGAATLNNILEVEPDSKMKRTQNRVLPQKKLSLTEALIFGLVCVIGGLSVLNYWVNELTALIGLATVASYVTLYTPLKQKTWFNTIIGAVPGALPPVGGWAAATGEVPVFAWILFLILFVWQLPHFYAIAWMFKDDYTNAGYKMLSVMDDTGVRTARQIIFNSGLLLVVSLMPVRFGMMGLIYAVGAIGLGIYMIRPGIKFAKLRTVENARAVLKSSVVYLPGLLVLIFIDGWVRWL